MTKSISIPGTVGASFDFVRRNPIGILRSIWLPALVGGGAFYFFLMTYLGELELFMRAPSQAHASIVLAVTGVAALVLLFIYAIALAAVTALALGGAPSSLPLQVGHREYRLYAALLRFLLVLLVLALAGVLLKMLLLRVVPGSAMIIDAVVTLLVLGLSLRFGFLLPAVAVATEQGLVLRQSWSLSRGMFWQLAAVALILLLPGLALEMAAEWLGRLAGIFPASSGHDGLRAGISLFHLIAPSFAVLLSVCALLTLVLQAAAAATVYRARSGGA